LRYAIGMDLGGSSAKLGLVSEQAAVLGREIVATPESGDPLLVLQPFAEAVDRLGALAHARGLQVAAIGCGVPGYLDPSRTVVDKNNIAALDGFAISPWLQQRFRLPVAVDNDACAAAIAEAASTGSDRHERVLSVTVGSGIGVVLVVGGDVARIMHGVTGDAAHIIVDHASRERCPLGCRGCLETVASARAIARLGQRAAESGASPLLAARLRNLGSVTGLHVSEAAAQGDPAALQIIRQAGYWLGVGLASWAPIYEPDLVLLGGAVAQAGDEWLAAATAAMRDVGYPFFVDRIEVRRSTLGNDAGMVGAALLALRQTRPPGRCHAAG